MYGMWTGQWRRLSRLRRLDHSIDGCKLPSTINSCVSLETVPEILLDPILEGDEHSDPCCYYIIAVLLLDY